MISGNVELECAYYTNLKKFIGFKINLAGNSKLGQNMMRNIMILSDQCKKLLL